MLSLFEWVHQQLTPWLVAVQGRLHGIVTCEHHTMQDLKQEAIAWNTDIRKNIALCNDLVPLARNTVAGKLEEKKAFADIEAIFLVRQQAQRLQWVKHWLSSVHMADSA